MTAPVLYAGDPRLLNKAGLLERIAELLEAETRYVERIHALEARLALYERAPEVSDWGVVMVPIWDAPEPPYRRPDPPEYWEWTL